MFNLKELSMNKQFLTTAALTAVLLLGTADISAYAAGVTYGGTSGTSTASGGAGGNNGNVTIGPGNGPLATLDNNGDPTNGGSQTDGDVNFGSLLSGLDLGGVDPGNIDLGGGGNGGTGGAGGNGGVRDGGGSGFQALASNLSSGDRQTLKLRCLNVLASPETHKSDVVDFCKMIAKL